MKFKTGPARTKKADRLTRYFDTIVALNTAQAVGMVRTERTGICFSYNPGVDPFKLTEAAGAKFRRRAVKKGEKPIKGLAAVGARQSR